MASLLHLEGGLLSLELGTAELPDLKRLVVKNWGAPEIIKYPALDVLSFAGQGFTFQNEWDDPCLISGTPEGAEILVLLHNQLNSK